jgi:hypothetical protein
MTIIEVPVGLDNNKQKTDTLRCDMKVRYNLSRNDMSWQIYCCETLWWKGYNDSNWWNNVVPENEKKGRDIQECSKCHKKYKLYYAHNEVHEIIEERVGK